MRKSTFLIALIGIFSVVHSCKHEPFEPTIVEQPKPDPDSIGCHPDTAYFERDVLQIILGNCAIGGCHDAASAQNDVILTDYAKIISTADVRAGDPDGSDLYEVITEDDVDKRMPYGRPPLSEEDIATIRLWIEQGAKDNTCTDTTDTNTGPIPTYTADIEPIISANCAITGCHADVQAPNLNTYAQVSAQAERIKIRTTAETMPPVGQPDLTQEQIEAIARWADNGTPEE